MRACIAYARLFLPEALEPRERLLEAAARGGTLDLPGTVKPTGA